MSIVRLYFMCHRLSQSPSWPAEETAKVRAAGFVPKVGTFVERVMHLYDGTSMPASDVRFLPSAS